MSIRSSGYYELAWPKDTPINPNRFWKAALEDLGEKLYLWCEIIDEYSLHVLNDAYEMFGKPLDEVQGLELHLVYECYEDGFYEFHLDIVDGKVRYEESRVIFVERPPEDCPVFIGH